MNVAVYSAIYGGYERVAQPLPADLPCPAFMFTDSFEIAEQAETVGWYASVGPPAEEFDVDPANGDPAITRPMLEHKYWKTHPIEAMRRPWRTGGDDDVDVSIWLDGNMRINVSGEEFVKRCLAALGDDDWSVMRHPWRDCIFDEAVYSSTLIYRYDGAAMLRQHDHYLAVGHPRHGGLLASGHMVRRHTPLVEQAGNRWWVENLTWSHQDQISLPFILRQAEIFEGLRWNAGLPWGGMWDLLPHGCG